MPILLWFNIIVDKINSNLLGLGSDLPIPTFMIVADGALLNLRNDAMLH